MATKSKTSFEKGCTNISLNFRYHYKEENALHQPQSLVHSLQKHQHNVGVSSKKYLNKFIYLIMHIKEILQEEKQTALLWVQSYWHKLGGEAIQTCLTPESKNPCLQFHMPIEHSILIPHRPAIETNLHQFPLFDIWWTKYTPNLDPGAPLIRYSMLKRRESARFCCV